MKAVFLCENEQNVLNVYDETARERIRGMAELDSKCYSKADVLSAPEKFKDVEIIFSTWGMPGFTEQEIKEFLPSLKCVFYAAGSVQYFARPFLLCKVKVFSAWAANAVPVAEYTVSQIILSGKDFFRQSRLLSQKRFDEAATRRGAHTGNFGKKVGLIGCGMVGSLVAEMLKRYDLTVLAYDPFLPEDKAKRLNVTLCPLDELFSSCSVVSNHLANNESTRKMLKYEHFISMPRYAAFINTGRGAQVVEADLVRALTERDDLTALLDVTDPEPPPPDHPFYTLENCFLSPHIAGSAGGEVVRMALYMADEFNRYLNNEKCPYEVTLKMLETIA